MTSTVGWDTLRAVTTMIGILAVGRAILVALRRVKPVTGGTFGASGHAAQAPSAQDSDRLELRV
ncbi:hypothetical protein [Pseudarthrobacter sp. TAF60_1]|uniref:hypothetical protein n=1 Tax=Pseudarthrobacter sp. TAF60_1 TaxID=3233071 RepID=UPI003F9A2C52